MKIVNPLYDYAFKYLMQNDRMTKKVLSTLLECEVLELTIEQQEVITVDDYRGLKLYRLDFSAVILNDKQERQKVLIELQKSKLPTNLLRFRSYLGDSYTRKEVLVNKQGKEEKTAYPIISIYILGYKVADIPYLAVNIDNKITNTVTKEEINLTSDFIDLLTHKTRIIQIRRLTKERLTRLERFLVLFNQAWVTKDNYILDLQEVPEDFRDVAMYLGGPVQDEAFRNQLKGEEEIDDIFKDQEIKLAEQEQELIEAKQREEEERHLKEEARQREKEARQRETATKLSFIKFLLQENTPIAKIAQVTGLSEEEVLALSKQL